MFLVVLIVGVTLVIVLNLPAWILGQMVGIPFLLYLISTLCYEPHGPYVKSMKSFGDMEKIYEELKQRTGHLKIVV